MGKFWLFIFLLLVAGAAAGAIFLMVWDIPAPTQSVEKVLPDDAFPQ